MKFLFIAAMVYHTGNGGSYSMPVVLTDSEQECAQVMQTYARSVPSKVDIQKDERMMKFEKEIPGWNPRFELRCEPLEVEQESIW